MQIKSTVYKIKGMRRDDSYSAFNSEFSWDNHNIRLTARDGNDFLSITNEKGNSQLSFNEITPIKEVNYSYTSSLLNYLLESVLNSYVYSPLLTNYIMEQTEGGVGLPAYTYNSLLENYLLEQTNI
jgi:hypothetical protein